MKTITLIRKAKKYIHVELDDLSKLVVTEDTVFKFAMYKGMQLSEADIEEIIAADNKQRALNKAANYLGYGMKTKKQVKDKLKEKGIDEESIEYAVDKLAEYNYIDDREYALQYAGRYSKKYGKKVIEMNLRAKGISKKYIEEAIESIEDIQEESAAAYIEKLLDKYSELEPRKRKQKVYENLMRKGFEWSDISHLFSERVK